ncbi:MAG: DMT family transporter [Flavobacteriales bacterium]|jgi:drug/metabolite transporter (DMT)-like permease
MKGKFATNLLLLHVIVLVWGLTGILGHEITLEPFLLVWWRVFIAIFAIGVIAFFSKTSLRISKYDALRFAGVGLLTAAHWVCFFASIKYSKISVALVVLSTSAFFVSVIHPVLKREAPRRYEMLLGLIVVGGLFLIFKFESEYAIGIALSLLAAFLAALFSTLNSRLVATREPTQIAWWEMLFAWLGLTVFLGLTDNNTNMLVLPSARDMWLLLVLGVLCTGVAFVVSIRVMRVLSPFTCALAINMEPVYTIIIALLLYGREEWMSPQFYLGGLVIVSTLFVDTWLKSRDHAKRA